VRNLGKTGEKSGETENFEKGVLERTQNGLVPPRVRSMLRGNAQERKGGQGWKNSST
jgi:hypothetical protein